MQKVFILVSTMIEAETGDKVIYKIQGVFYSKLDAQHSLNVLQPKSFLDLEIIEKDII